MVKRLPPMLETLVRSLSWEDLLAKEMATHSSILAWRIPQRSLVGYSPWGRKESDRTERLHLLSNGVGRRKAETAGEVCCWFLTVVFAFLHPRGLMILLPRPR